MSQANAAAIRRRVNAPNTNQSPLINSSQKSQTSSDQSNVNNPGLTLPQVIALVDRRLVNLETFMKETQNTNIQKPNVQFNIQEPVSNNSDNESLKILIDEYNHRFEVLADEIANMKDIVLKLQTYTMEVNKTLMDERIHVFSDLGNSQQNDFNNLVLDNVNVDSTESTSIDLRNLVKEEFLSE
jgi:hypothetical protein